ncbi:hypothetical protein Acr_13g0007250 [Actinidia rufa]|uniref:Uncharacterized protein n=1 Tax=Actinidia rufa TaxID=165716 RepID=A0A7J0FKV0_9ERIC|nr:hypothetical protein Acr_13g0007250 [Actinidia rufa]
MYEPIYRHTILHMTDELGRISLPSLHIEGRAPQREAFSSEKSGDKLSAHRPLPMFKVRKMASPQAHRATLSRITLIVKRRNSDNEHSDDLAHTLLQPAREVEIVHSFSEVCNLGTSSEETNIMMFRTLGRPQQKKTVPTVDPPATAVHPARVQSLANDKGKRLRLARPKGSRGGREGRALSFLNQVLMPSCGSSVAQRCCQSPRGGLECHEGFTGDAAIQARDASYAATTQAQNKAATARVKRDKALKDLAELPHVCLLLTS